MFMQSNYILPVYRDTEAGLILTVQLGSTQGGSTLCMSYSNIGAPNCLMTATDHTQQLLFYCKTED